MSQSTSAIIREILTEKPDIVAADAVKIAKARGAKGDDNVLKNTVYNLRSAMKKEGNLPAPSAERTTTPPSAAAPAPAARPEARSSGDTAALVENVIAATMLCGGTANALSVASIIQRVGVDDFARIVELIGKVKQG